jgi:thiol peroxidase
MVLTACSHATSESDVIDYLKAQPPAARATLVSKSEGRVAAAGAIHRGDKPLTLVGPTLDVGAAMPDVTLLDGKLEPVKLAALRGSVVVLSVVPSIDTRVCESQTHHVSAAIEQMPAGVKVFTVSRDLPYAQTRFAEEAMVKTQMASDYHGGAFGRAFGVEVEETGLLARSIWVIGTDGVIAYRQLVDDQGTEPDYDGMIAAVKKLSGGTSP